MRVLHFVPSLNINAGMMSVIMNYYRHINTEKIQFDFLYMYEMDQTFQTEIEDRGGRCYFIGTPSLGNHFFKSLDTFFKLNENKYDIVHCHMIFGAQLISTIAKRNGINHIIAHSHSTKFSDKPISAVRNAVLSKALPLFATDYIACSPEAALLFGKRINCNHNVMVLNNAIDTDTFKYDKRARHTLRETFGVGKSTVALGNVGRLAVQKNQKFLLEIFSKYLLINDNAVLFIVGDGELKDKLLSYSKSLGISEKVIFTGKRTDVSDLLSMFDVFLLPSLFEGAPVSAIEAQASGLKCMLSDTITKSIDVLNCEYMSIHSAPQKWASFINSLIVDDDNRTLASQKMVKAGFDLSTEAVKLEQYYYNMVK